MSGAPGDNILVTGALGQIGTELVEALRAKHGASAVIASDIRSFDGIDSGRDAPFIILDVLDTEAIIDILSHCMEKLCHRHQEL